MKIKHIRTTRLSVPFKVQPLMSKGYNRPREFLIVEIETASGIVGMGYVIMLRGGSATVESCVREMMAPQIIGRDATEIEGIWNGLYRSTQDLGRMGVAGFAISAIDIALWDIVGKKAGMPLHRLWGHCRDEIPVYGSGCWRGLGGDGMAEKAKEYVSQGFKAIKMQVGHMYSDRQDVANVRMVRDAVGPDIDIMIDVNMAWTPDRAIQVGRKIEEFDVYWLEEPVVPWDIPGYLRIAEKLDIRIVGGESHWTRWDLRPFFENPQIPILQPDPARGGLTELRKIAATAETWGITIAPHHFPELMVQLLASIPNAHILEFMDWFDDLFVDPPRPENGFMRPPEAPGHGLVLDRDMVKEHTING